MANPRKFSEKIALHNQKQAEETAAFERIMREVSDATSKVVTQKKNLAPATNLGAFKGGSLPNVSEQNRKQQTATAQVVDATKNTSKQPDENTLLQFGLGAQNTINDITTQKNSSSQNTTPYRESRGRGVGPMRRPGDRKIDTSPYSSGNVAYLSPPSDSNWRRVNSDSAIHQSLMQNQDNHHSHGSHSPIPTSPVAQRRITNTSSNIDIKSFTNEHGNSFVLSLNDNRPRSSCGLPRLPGINIYPSAHDNTVQIPIGNNTGSLPDLTSVHFPSPLHTPLDQEHDHSSSPYSSSPVTTSPATLSPTSIPTRHPTARFPYSPVNSPGEVVSPTHSHGTSQGNSAENNSYQTNQSGQNAYVNQSPQQQQQSPQQQQQQTNIYQQQQHSPPNNALHGSQSNLATLTQSNLSGYRSPGRPSPGSSPGLVAMPNNDSNTSAPCSPASQPLGNNGQYDQFQTTEYYLNPSIQQHFEQFSLVDNPLNDYTASSPLNQPYSPYDDGGFIPSGLDSIQTNQMQMSSGQMGLSNPNINLNSTTLANDTSNHQSNQAHLQQPLHSPTSPQHQTQSQNQQASNSHHQQMSQNSQQHGPQTPNTPTSIPEIIFTDFSGTGELTKDLFDQPIELELGAMDFAGFQMLSDPNATMIADPTIEDSFRRDLN